jgi:Na+-translocating ferredoxin:NAD+ oxidoreductase RnfC subunit
LPLVRTGDTVAAGQPLGAVPEKSLGAIIHAPFAGTVGEVTATHVILDRNQAG